MVKINSIDNSCLTQTGQKVSKHLARIS